MMRNRHSRTAFAWIEMLVIIAILLVIASFFVRLRYGQAWLAAEYSFVQSLGINRDVYDTAKISVLCIALLCYAVYRFTRKRRRP